ncbi:glutamate ABC transporter substrate-binding protein [Mangrovihabitans endophyticus]|uniref:Glutamate-binding protein n=1 Tax=Mangrovihabitans endophyticus TaxID=1751298 RepID=A0A8J3FSQ1_9ACTN|nr:glutamate ABC transporter substrate-binding protein [Mangrovihabitans endophyticus]GGL18649.1 glutamate-binding protein [Mangrovihabitans endophyticus]
MRTTRLAATFGALAMVLAAAACGGDDDSSDEGGAGSVSFPAGTTMAKLNQAQKLRVGTKFDQPGFGLKGLSGKPEGFDVEIAKIVADGLGIPEDKIEYTETPSTVREQVIQQDKVDIVVATYTINDKRKQVIDFAGPYYIAGQAIMVKKDDNSITGPDSFKDGTKKVCTVTNSTPAANIEQYLANKDQQLVLFDIYQKCVDALKGGQVDAVTTDNVILTGFIATNEDQFKLAGETFTEEPYGIGLKKGDDKFRDFINDQLEESFQDGSYLEAWKSTAGKYDPNDPKIPTVDRY